MVPGGLTLGPALNFQLKLLANVLTYEFIQLEVLFNTVLRLRSSFG